MKSLSGQSCFPSPGSRIIVVGVTGSGKTTTAAQLSKILGLPHVELDALHWLPGWQMVEREVFRDRVTEVLSSPAWVADGNYRKARDIIWSRADTLVWLDYPLPVILWQLTQRTLRRIITCEELWNSNNRETIRGTFFSKDSLYIWAFQSYGRLRKDFQQDIDCQVYPHLQVIRFQRRNETNRWLAWLETKEELS